MTQNSVYCTAPFNGLTIREDGHVRTCCAGRISLGHLDHMAVTDIEESPELKQIQQRMLSNLYHYENCQSCIDQERTNGLATLRQHYLKFYPEFDQERLTLKFIDVRWNNSCNLGCLYCSPSFSSVWVDRLQQQNKVRPTKSYQDDLLHWILERIDHVREIMLVGGEPLLMKQNYYLLSQLPMDCKISIITNLSYNLKELPCWKDLIKRPADNVIWNVSLENIGKKFEYVRSGGIWSQVEKNIMLLKQYWPDTVSLNMVYNLFSAFDLLDTIEYFHSNNIKKFNLFPVNNNAQIELSNFPHDIRLQAANYLELTMQRHLDLIHVEDRALYPLQGSHSILKSLLEKQDKHTITLETFEKQIDWYDQWGVWKFHDLWPELNGSIKQRLKTC